jgi:UDP-glucuronate decarboxylase
MTNPIVLEDIERIDAALPKGRFEDATVVVTGCAGFLGFYITQYFVRRAASLGLRKVVGLDTFMLGKPKWLTKLAANFPDVLELRHFDISRDPIGEIKMAKDAAYVIHMASIASPTFYRRYPIETVDANIWGLRRLLEFYKESSTLRGFLFFSSSEIYGDPPASAIPTAEDYRGNVACVGPRACYDEAKRFGETLCYIFAKTYNMPITVARPFNNYGPGMRVGDRRLPADFARCVFEHRDIVILSDGLPTRTFCYVADAIAGYFLCLLYGQFDVFNIGIEEPEVTVREFAEIYRAAGRELFGYEGTIAYERSKDTEYLADNPNRRCPSTVKARERLGYDPRVFVEEGVHRYLKFLKHEMEVS